MSSTSIVATFSVPGLHHWPDAPERRAYLRDLHRHLFMVTIEHDVDHGDRDIEFHDLAEKAEQEFRALGQPYHPESTLISFGATSCENLATLLAARLQMEGYSPSSITVSEDGENDGRWAA